MEPGPSSSGALAKKRRREVLTIEKKLEIIDELQKGASAVALSARYDVPRTTINDLKKNADQIKAFASQMESLDGQPKKRKTMKKATNEVLDTAVYLWFVQKRSEGIPVSGPMVCEKAIFFNEKLGGGGQFKASTGWLKNFKHRHGIRELNIEGEKMSAASGEAVDAFKIKFQKMLDEKGLTRDQVYNADETGLNYKALPTKTLASLSEKYAPGFKMQKQRITVMVCANASGKNRMPLLVIGKAKKPRCFKGFNMNALPVHYYAQKSAWMSQAIFTDWFKTKFVPPVQRDLESKNLPPKAVLVLDNAPSHPEENLQSDDGNITCYFLPANTTSLIQPMDQSVIETLKRRYRKKFMQELLSEDVPLKDYWKSIDLKNVVDNVADAWTEVAPETLERSWNKVWPANESASSEIIDECTAVTNEFLADTTSALNLESGEFEEWLHCDDADVGYQLLTDEEIIELVVEEDENTDCDTDDTEYDGGELADAAPTVADLRKEAKQAVSLMQKYIEWYEQQDEAERTDTVLLRRFRSFAEKKSLISVKQPKLTEYFSTKKD